MESVHFDQHISTRFNEELEALRTRALGMGGLVEKQLENAMKAIVEGDVELAEQVVHNDYTINALEVEIDEEAIAVLARRQPAASDLRLVVSIIKTITDLERMGDESQRIGRMAMKLAGCKVPESRYKELRNLGNHVQKMLHETLDAFARTDIDAAVKVHKEDNRVDQEYEAIMRQMIAYMTEDPRNIPRALEIMWSARALERIGDRACNICEYVIYFVRGRDVRHINLEKALSEETANTVAAKKEDTNDQPF